MSFPPIPGAGLLGEDVMVTTRDGRRLRTMVDGPDGGTTVVLEAGLGASALYWMPVQRLLRHEFQVIAYDRAGIGGSDPSAQPRTLEALAADLQTVIDAFPHQRVVLAGHSWGGPIIRVAAAHRLAIGGRDISGLVLVDQSDEHDRQFFSARVRGEFAMTAGLMTLLAGAARVLPLRRMFTAGTPTPLHRGMVEASYTPQAARAFGAELRPVTDQLRWLLAHPQDFGDLPIRVLSGQQIPPFSTRTRTEIVAAHHKTVESHAGAVFVPAYGSAHGIPTTEPALIADQIRELAAQAG